MNKYPRMTNEQYREKLAEIFTLLDNRHLRYFYIFITAFLDKREGA